MSEYCCPHGRRKEWCDTCAPNPKPRKPTRMRRIGWQIVWTSGETGDGDCLYATKKLAKSIAMNYGTVRAVYVKVEEEGE